MEEKKAFQNHSIVALVSTNAIGGVQEAYPNYFADSEDFIKYLHIINSSYLNIESWNFLNCGIALLYKFKKPLTIK